jgi:acetyltransferase-like isoleucine patch superfamily enzyme
MNTIKILFLSADPADTVRLRLQEELRNIREKIQLSRHRDSCSIESRESVRAGDISQAIFDVEPQIVHFSGHGTSAGELCFEDSQGKKKTLKPDALASLFKLVASQVSCVVLNACYSETQARSIAKHIPFVIGMNQAIGDRAAIAFSVGFYRALGAGRSVKDAYEFACVEIQLEGIPEYLTPILLEKEKIIKEGEIERNEINEFIAGASFFSQRFSISFPGVRGIQRFGSSGEAIARLSKLLQAPLKFNKDDSVYNPIWWFRGTRNLQIESFEHIEDDIVLINNQELKIKDVVAVNARSYYQCFVYIEAYPMKPSGLYTWEENEIQGQINRYGYCSEEFGVYQRNFLVKRSEYDDGAASIDGKIVDLDRRATELRIRYLSSYNLVIASVKNSLNNLSFDSYFQEIMNNILRGHASIEDLSKAVLELPKRTFN